MLYGASRAEIIPTKNIPSNTPAPPMEINPPNFQALFKFKISAPISTPKVPEIKAAGAENAGARIIAKMAENTGGMMAGKEIPLPGTTLARNFEITIIKRVAIKIGFNSKPNFKVKNRK